MVPTRPKDLCASVACSGSGVIRWLDTARDRGDDVDRSRIFGWAGFHPRWQRSCVFSSHSVLHLPSPGFVMEAHTHLPSVRESFSPCREELEKCQLPGKGVDLTVLGTDRHSLLGWAVCSSGEPKISEKSAAIESPASGVVSA